MEVKEVIECWNFGGTTSFWCPAVGMSQKRAEGIAGQGLTNPTTKHNISHYRLNNLTHWYTDLATCCTVEDL